MLKRIISGLLVLALVGCGSSTATDVPAASEAPAVSPTTQAVTTEASGVNPTVASLPEPAVLMQTGVFTEVQAASIKPGDAIPAPQGAPVLTVTGKLGTTNVTETLLLDMETLEKLGTVTYTLDDPYLKKTVTYEGVLMTTLFDVINAPTSVTEFKAIALDGYSIKIPLDLLRKWPVILATKRDGERMPSDDKGPLEIVFPYHAFNFDHDIYHIYWVYQLYGMDFSE